VKSPVEGGRDSEPPYPSGPPPGDGGPELLPVPVTQAGTVADWALRVGSVSPQCQWRSGRSRLRRASPDEPAPRLGGPPAGPPRRRPGREPGARARARPGPATESGPPSLSHCDSRRCRPGPAFLGPCAAPAECALGTLCGTQPNGSCWPLNLRGLYPVPLSSRGRLGVQGQVRSA
jgi:hypothetical protein